jgi:lipopolysaccharide export system protein LptA
LTRKENKKPKLGAHIPAVALRHNGRFQRRPPTVLVGCQADRKLSNRSRSSQVQSFRIPDVHCLQMAFQPSRLRRWFAAGAVLAAAVVAGAYFYAQRKVQNALKQVPEKIGLEIQQSANGFTISRSVEGRTLFKIQAQKVVKFKAGGRSELHGVAIVLYGQDSSRFDQIYGSDFEYDPQSGDITADGPVQIDLEANPAGLTSPDQAPPKELKDPIHLETSGLVFNQKTGNAYTRQRIDFRIPQAKGWAQGVSYASKGNVLTLQSQVHVEFSGPDPVTITGARGIITKDPKAIELDDARIENIKQIAQADKTRLFLRSNNTISRVLASGNVRLQSRGAGEGHIQAANLELSLAGREETLQSAVFSGDVQIEAAGVEPVQGSAGRVVLSFSGRRILSKVHAEGKVRLRQRQQSSMHSPNAQDVELRAPAMDFLLSAGRRLESAQTVGAGEIVVQPVGSDADRTVVTAGKMAARFDASGRISSIHGAPAARIVNSNPGQPDRVSTSDALEVSFSSGRGIEAITQVGDMAYTDGELKARADRARYTPADQMLELVGSPRVTEGGMATTARAMRLNRATGDAFADGDVKTTYSDLKAEPDGALLSSSSPIHVTAHAMTIHRTPAVATYTGQARLWQDANVIQAPVIEFDRDHRSMVAKGSMLRGSSDKQSYDSGPPQQPVSTVLIQADKSGKVSPVTLTSNRLSYIDKERTARLEGDVTAKAGDFTVSADRMDVFLHPRNQSAGHLPGEDASRLDRIVAQGQVVVAQPTRRATGDKLVYTAGDDKFVLSGGPPSIFDAEHGKITGVSLTLFRRDDRVLVEGTVTSPSVTQTRVAR